MRSISWAKISGEVKYSPGSVRAPSTEIWVVLRKVATGLSKSVARNMISPGTRRKPGSDDAGYTGGVTWIADARPGGRVLSLRSLRSTVARRWTMTWRLA